MATSARSSPTRPEPRLRRRPPRRARSRRRRGRASASPSWAEGRPSTFTMTARVTGRLWSRRIQPSSAGSRSATTKSSARVRGSRRNCSTIRRVRAAIRAASCFRDGRSTGGAADPGRPRRIRRPRTPAPFASRRRQERLLEILGPGPRPELGRSPPAMTRPARMNRSSSQRPASSMTWLETRIVEPAAASARKWLQNWTRRAGSIPTVGSSRNSTEGPWTSAQASDSRRRMPPDSSIPGGRAGRTARPAPAPGPGPPGRLPPNSAAKNRRFSQTDSSG